MNEITDVKPGTIIGPYEIRRGFRAQGGMARVFEAEVRDKYWHEGLPKRVALKFAKEDYQDALLIEADFLERVRHPHVVQLLALPNFPSRDVYTARADLPPLGSGWYYAMEFLDGGGLEDYLTRTTRMTDMFANPPRQERPLGVLVAVGVAKQIASALTHIHEQNIVNLDIKPANILFKIQKFKALRHSVPHAVLGDFGIARDVRYPRTSVSGMATREYVSPEHAREILRETENQFQDLPEEAFIVDGRSDIFSLGVVLYEMLTGCLPFANTNFTLDPNFDPAPPSSLKKGISSRVDEVVLHALKKDPKERFQNAKEMLDALKHIRTPPDWSRAKRVFSRLAVTSMFFVGVWGGFRSWQHDQINKTPLPVVTKNTSAPTAIVTEATTPPTLTSEPTLRPTATSRPTSTPRP